MTDSTDNAQGPERIWWNAAPMPHSHTSTVQFAGGAEYIRADLAPDPQDARVKALVEAVRRMHETVGISWAARDALAAFDKGGKDDA